ncbi:galactose-1-phosphate uridylyltransferase [Bailinhaonella thermotolerans]|uniref:Galactose-1-phosphate uridylyltransferase n=1 Tax=Bailinhaonella thermotolerans TaxID=1070861 RepID=A0A3A4A0C7_9ACTN|nr:galactose-1-phosphate uridylyltransferase [Bailinhaonella thermotolerans]
MRAAYRTSGKLADGREIIYFDDGPGHVRDGVDGRDLPAFEAGTLRRWDPLLGQEIMIAARRQNRTFQPSSGDCPLCPTRPGHATEIPAPDYHVVSFENRFPSLGGPAGGRCEVVCFSADHDTSLASLPPERLATIGRAWADRTAELSALPGVEYVFVFENRGLDIGATLQHPHGQIYAFPFVPPVAAAVRDNLRRHREAHGECLMCAIVAREAEGPRVIATAGDFVAYVPEAARWPYEAHIAPRRCVAGLPDLGEEERATLMGLYADVVGRFERLFARPPAYMACWHQSPPADPAHMYAQVFTVRRSEDKLKYLASVESGAGAFINDVLPEEAAERLRSA